MIFKRQFGFRSGYNHAIVDLVESTKKYIDNDNYMCSMFIDLEKAFDTVDYQVLLQKRIYSIDHNLFLYQVFLHN